jgi:hypothetical protein
LLSERPANLLCVTGEANAWPYRRQELRTSYPDELVHWVAHRPATGETFDMIVRPSSPLAPSTPSHIGLAEGSILGGALASELFERWRAFVHEDDVVCSWGHYAAGIFVLAGGDLPRTRVDLRAVSRELLRARVGAMDELLGGLGIAPSSLESVGRGRAGARAAQLARIASLLIERGQEQARELLGAAPGPPPTLADRPDLAR